MPRSNENPRQIPAYINAVLGAEAALSQYRCAADSNIYSARDWAFARGNAWELVLD